MSFTEQGISGQQVNQLNSTYFPNEVSIPINNSSYTSKNLPVGETNSARIRQNSDTGITEIEDTVSGAWKPISPLARVISFIVGSGGNIPGTTTPVPANGDTSVVIPSLAGISGGVIRYNSTDIINNSGITFLSGGGFQPSTPFQTGESWFWEINTSTFLPIGNYSQKKIVATYAQMLSLINPGTSVDFLVLNDENKSQINTTYSYYDDTTNSTLVWVASLKEII